MVPIAAAIIPAVIGAGASMIAGSKNSKAISQATNAQTESNAASIALQRDVYGQNKALSQPFYDRGNAAGGAINALLGLGGQPAAQPAYQQPAASGPYGQSALAQFAPQTYDYSGQVFDGGEQPYMVSGGDPRFPAEAQEPGYSRMGGPQAPNAGFGFNGGYAGAQGQPTAVPGAMTPVATGMTPQQAQANAFDAFRNSTGYQFRLGEGQNAINSGYAASGTLQSGAALKALTRYGQDFASNEFGNYVGLLGQQQAVGAGAAGALAGVGTNYANNVTSLNAANAAAIGQGAVARANNSNAMIGGIGNALGGLAGGIFGGSSYGR